MHLLYILSSAIAEIPSLEEIATLGINEVERMGDLRVKSRGKNVSGPP